ncbi:helix-turn-helix transcriptional regulator [Roseibacillus persicicus]|uniref:helix-turn-helix transcriptional regulator n=1 Tax=Roseibacillus persicicus TaxID=454148 RepID=UPI0028102617|nr:WYL domain-containing protein [Roseibacillus persicicus]MDQ8192517.1 WYL domain-containing protein [Roseibacillus persicicus]
MPRASHQQTIYRQWLILRKLTTRRPGITAREMRDHLETEDVSVTKRTVERDLNELSRIFPLETSIGSPPIGWRWREGAVQELPGLELVDALSLSLVGDLLNQTLPSSLHPSISARVTEARRKLDALPNHSASNWSQLVRYIPPGQPLLKPRVDPEILHTIEEGLVGQKQIAVSYQSPTSTAPWNTHMHPIALLSHGSTPYLLACLGEHSKIWQYPLHRFHSVELTDIPSWRPPDFDLDDYLAKGEANFGNKKTIRLEAQVEEDLANILRETPLSEDQTIRQKGEHLHLKATVKDSWQLTFYLLSQGHRITVLKPKSLRNEIISSLQSALNNYQQS